MDDSGGCAAIWMHLAPLNCVLRDSWNDKFYITCTFHTKWQNYRLEYCHLNCQGINNFRRCVKFTKER
jgi:hypothetical protein